MPNIPPRQPIVDYVRGAVIRVGNQAVLGVGGDYAADELVVRYGVRYLGKPFLSIVPGLVALDYGDFLTGEAAWDFLIKRSNLHPRAEVFGFRNDGRDEMMLVRQLDLALPPEVLVYADELATTPSAKLVALIASVEWAQTLPLRLRQALPKYDTLAEWQAASP